MKQKNLIALAAVTAVVVVAAVVSTNNRPDASAATASSSGLPLVEGLTDRLNDVALLEISNNGTSLTIEKKGADWVIQDAGGYPAKFEAVKKALVSIADLKVAEPKTSDPERYEELGVQDPAEGASTPTLIVLKDGSGGALATLVIGDSKPGRSPELYVRKVGEPQAWKVKGRVEAGTDPKSWMETQVANISSDRTSDVTIVHADGERLRVYKEQRSNTNFTIEGVPEGRELLSPTIANYLGSSLSNLGFDEVLPAAEIDFASPLATTEIRTWDGLVVVARLAEHEGASWVRLEARYEAPPAKAQVADADAETIEDGGEGAGDDLEAKAEVADAASETEATAVRAEAAKLNRDLSPWAFRFPSYKQSNLEKRLEELLKPSLPELGEPEGETLDPGMEGAEQEVIPDDGDGHDHSHDYSGDGTSSGD